ncbi:MAG: polysaccharide biosynthesis protein, partial [Roseateles sp.]
MTWLALDTTLTRIRPYRERLSMVLDMLAVAVAWQGTYLFRLGFERWFSARPDYDPWVMAGVVLEYGVLLKLLRVPQGMWRFSGFGEVKRLALACGVAGLVSATAILMLRLHGIPRAVL